MGGDSKGDSTETQINRDLAAASKPLIERSSVLGELPYTPNRGIQFAAFNPMQTNAMQNSANATGAFGMLAPSDAMTQMPQAQMGSAGILGYGTGEAYDDNLNASMPQSLQDYYASFFRDPNQAFTPNSPSIATARPSVGAGGFITGSTGGER